MQARRRTKTHAWRWCCAGGVTICGVVRLGHAFAAPRRHFRSAGPRAAAYYHSLPRSLRLWVRITRPQTNRFERLQTTTGARLGKARGSRTCSGRGWGRRLRHNMRMGTDDGAPARVPQAGWSDADGSRASSLPLGTVFTDAYALG